MKNEQNWKTTFTIFEEIWTKIRNLDKIFHEIGDLTKFVILRGQKCLFGRAAEINYYLID